MFSATSLCAYILSPKELTQHDTFVQVGALKKADSIRQLVKKLDAFALYVQRDNQISRVFVVLHKKDQKTKVLMRKIRKIIPDAFIKKSFIPHSFSTLKTHKSSMSKNDFNNSLDAEAILRTRKQFF